MKPRYLINSIAGLVYYVCAVMYVVLLSLHSQSVMIFTGTGALLQSLKYPQFVLFICRYLCDFSYFSSLHINHRNAAFIHVPPLDAPYTAAELSQGLRVAINDMISQVLQQP